MSVPFIFYFLSSVYISTDIVSLVEKIHFNVLIFIILADQIISTYDKLAIENVLKEIHFCTT